MRVRLSATFLILLAWLAAPAFAQQPTPTGARSPEGLWQSATDQNLPAAQRRANLRGAYAVARLDRGVLDRLLAQAPRDTALNRATAAAVVISLPTPDGGFARFAVEETSMLAPELEQAFPDIKIYRGSGLDDTTATLRLDVTPLGVHAQIISSTGTTYVDPYAPGDLVNHVSFDKSSMQREGAPFADFVYGDATTPMRLYTDLPISHGTQTRTYRLALAATYEYTVAAGGTKPAALSRMVTTMNRVNGIYEREVSVRMTLATGTGADPTALIYDTSTDPYTNNSGSTMLSENQANIDTVVGSANYDIGHVFSTGGGGIANLNSPCSPTLKARGVTGLPNPVGDAFDVDYVAHEMGHQFGGNHTFNSTSSNCAAPNRSASHAYEVGSGSTIMAYAGICSPEDTQKNSNDLFTVDSLNEITAFITSGGGSSCPVTTTNGNTAPTVTSPGTTFTIPANTPFALTAAGTDANSDTLTYIWEEHDLGTASLGGNANVDDGSRPLFRSYTASVSPTRYFPSLSYILNNNNVPPATYSCGGSSCIVGEVLPSTSRTMNFWVTVRDNRAGGGGIGTASTQVVVNATMGPFAITSQNTAATLAGLSAQTVTWSVNGTGPLAANVAILFSVDGGVSFPYTLVASTPNDGSQAVVIPSVTTSLGRIKVQAVGNIFFDINNANLTVTAATSGGRPGDFDGDRKTDVAVYRPGDGKWYVRNSTNGSLTSTQWGWPTDTPVAGDYDGDGRTDLAVWRPSNGTWYVLNSSDSSVTVLQWGWPTDTPHPGDYDGDGRTDFAVYRPTTGTWYIRNSSNQSVTVQQWGWSSDQPVPADYDGDRRIDIAVFRPSTGTWYILRSSGGVGVQQWGWSSDRPVAADYDGDGRADIAVWRPTDGTWYILNSATSSLTSIQWGWSTDTPVIGDFDGDGLSDAAVFRASNATWYIRNSATVTLSTYQWGLLGDVPLHTLLP